MPADWRAAEQDCPELSLQHEKDVFYEEGGM